MRSCTASVGTASACMVRSCTALGDTAWDAQRGYTRCEPAWREPAWREPAWRGHAQRVGVYGMDVHSASMHGVGLHNLSWHDMDLQCVGVCLHSMVAIFSVVCTERSHSGFKGTVARDSRSLFFSEIDPIWTPDSHSKLLYFRIRFRLREDIRKITCIGVVGDSAESKKYQVR